MVEIDLKNYDYKITHLFVNKELVDMEYEIKNGGIPKPIKDMGGRYLGFKISIFPVIKKDRKIRNREEIYYFTFHEGEINKSNSLKKMLEKKGIKILDSRINEERTSEEENSLLSSDPPYYYLILFSVLNLKKYSGLF